MNAVAKEISKMNQEEIHSLENNGVFELSIEKDTKIDLLIGQVEITFGEIDGKQVASNDMFTIALDISVSDELLSEGISREFINKIQNERKNMGLEVTDKIQIYIDGNSDLLTSSLMNHKEFICNETQSQFIDIKDSIDSPKDMEINISSDNLDRNKLNYKIIKV